MDRKSIYKPKGLRYENPEGGCPNCGRDRVIIYDDGKHRCEKCAWYIEDGRYE